MVPSKTVLPFVCVCVWLGSEWGGAYVALSWWRLSTIHPCVTDMAAMCTRVANGANDG